MTDARVALVTGGATGIGRAISIELARRGFSVVVGYHSSERDAVELAEHLAGIGSPASAFKICQVDVSDVSSVKRLIAFVRSELGRLDVLVNNAGVLHEELFFLTSIETFWSVLQTNFGGVVNTCKCALPLLTRRKGARIINISSIAGIHATAGLSAYASSKAAVIALSNVLARELASAAVSVNTVAPGLVDTAMAAAMRDPRARERAIGSQPVTRMGTPDEVARVVGFLADDAPPYLTGEVLRVDGGAMIGG